MWPNRSSVLSEAVPERHSPGLAKVRAVGDKSGKQRPSQAQGRSYPLAPLAGHYFGCVSRLLCPVSHYPEGVERGPERVNEVTTAIEVTTANEVTLARVDFEDGQILPRVCVLSGGRADRLYRRSVIYLPRWVYLLIPVGIPVVAILHSVLSRFTDWSPPGQVWILLGALPFAVGRYFRTVKMSGWIPMSARANRELARHQQLRWAAAVASAIFGFVAVVSFLGSADWGFAFVVLGVIPLLLAALAVGTFWRLSWELGSLDLGLELGPGPHQVRLTNVHPNFAEALGARSLRSGSLASRSLRSGQTGSDELL